MRSAALLVLATCAIALIGCGEKAPPPEGKPKDPYAGMTKEQKIDAIRNDPKITGMQKETMIADLQRGG